MGPPITPVSACKKLSLGSGSDTEFTPTQSQSQITPNRSLDGNQDENQYPPAPLDTSLGFSPNEIRRMMAICVIPSPETPKIVAQIWKNFVSQFGKGTPTPDGKVEEPMAVSPPSHRTIPPCDFSNLEDEDVDEPMDQAQDEEVNYMRENANLNHIVHGHRFQMSECHLFK
jgi:hypothetical protein